MATDRLQYIFDILKGKDTLGPQFKALDKQSQKLEKNLIDVAKKSAVAFTALGATIAATVFEAAKFEDIGVQFEVLTGSIEKATDALTQLKEFSAGTPFQFADIAKAGKQLLGFGFTTGELTNRLREIGNVAAASGTQIQEISLIFGQVAAAGKLTGERLLQFQERAIPIGPALAKTLGIAESSVKDFVSQGKVDLATFQKAFASLSEKGGFAFGGLAKLSGTLSGKISTLKDNFSLLVASIGEQFLPIAKAATDRLIAIVQVLRKNENFAKFVAGVLGLATGIAAVVTIGGPLIVLLIKLRKTVLALSIAAQILGISFKKALIGSGIGAAIIAIGILITDLAFNWEKRVEQMTLVWTNFVDVIKGTGRGLAKILKGAVTFDFDQIKKGAAEISSSFKASFRDVSDGLDEIEEKGKKTKVEVPLALKIDDPKKVVEKSLSDLKKELDIQKGIIKSPLDILFDPETSDLNKLGSALSKVLEGSTEGFKKALTKVDPKDAAAFGAGLFSAVTSGKEGAKKLLTGAAKAVGAAFGGPVGGAIAEAIIGPLMMAPEEFAKQIMEFFESLPQLISNIFTNAINFDQIATRGIMAFVQRIPFLVDNLINTIITKTADPTFIANLSVNLALAIAKALVKLPESVASGFRDGINNALANTKDSFRKVFIDGGKQVVEGIVSGVNKIADLGRTIGSEFIAKIIGVGKRIADEFKAAIGNILSIGGGGGILGSITGALGLSTVGSIVAGPIGGAVGAIGGAFGFARGGEIPSGFPNDSFPARLSSGENVIDRSTNSELKSFLRNGSERTNELLNQVISLLSAPMKVQSNVEIDGRSFAEVILELNRRNERLA